jgi:hypothetical protein
MHHEPEDLGRARVEPLRVVDREEHRVVTSQGLDDRCQGYDEQSGVWRGSFGLAHQEGALQRTTLGRRQSRCRLIDHRGEQVTDAREGSLSLRRARPQHEDAQPAVLGLA